MPNTNTLLHCQVNHQHTHIHTHRQKHSSQPIFQLIPDSSYLSMRAETHTKLGLTWEFEAPITYLISTRSGMCWGELQRHTHTHTQVHYDSTGHTTPWPDISQEGFTLFSRGSTHSLWETVCNTQGMCVCMTLYNIPMSVCQCVCVCVCLCV